MSEQRETRIPKYHRIADSVRALIRSGGLSAGDRLPPETKIAADHGTSVPTVRQAMSVLRAEGLIESRHGVGTFVRDATRFQRRSRNRYGEARGRTGLLNTTFRHQIVEAGPTAPPDYIAAALGCDEDTTVIVRRRHLFDEHDALQEIGASFLPASFAAGTYLAEPVVVPQALFRCVEDMTGKRYAHARDAWEARPCTAQESDAFGIPTGAYVMHVVHTATAEDGTVLEVSESTWPADRIALIDEYDIPGQAEDPTARSDI